MSFLEGDDDDEKTVTLASGEKVSVEDITTATATTTKPLPRTPPDTDLAANADELFDALHKWSHLVLENNADAPAKIKGAPTPDSIKAMRERTAECKTEISKIEGEMNIVRVGLLYGPRSCMNEFVQIGGAIEYRCGSGLALSSNGK